jgi:hypothetical protein
MSTGGEVANALVCKTSIRGFNSLPVLQIKFSNLCGDATNLNEMCLLGSKVQVKSCGIPPFAKKREGWGTRSFVVT